MSEHHCDCCKNQKKHKRLLILKFKNPLSIEQKNHLSSQVTHALDGTDYKVLVLDAECEIYEAGHE